MDNIKHVFFDLDHTLWDFDKNSKLSFEQIFREQKIAVALDDFLEAYTPINFEYWKLYREEKVNKATLRYRRLKDTFDALNYTVNDDLINVLSEDFIKFLPNYNHLIEGTIDVLDYLSEKYQLHIITNGFKEVQDLKLEKSNIKKYFKTVITSESVGVKKPNPKIFEYALAQVSAQPQDCIMIGDNIEADILGAFNAGILPIHLELNKTTNTKNAFAQINALNELKQYL